MKKILVSILCVTTLIILVACGASGIVGKWYYEEDGGSGEYAQFNDDGTVTYSFKDTIDTYIVEDNILKIFNEDGVQSSDNLKISGNKILFEDGSIAVYRLNRDINNIDKSKIIGKWNPVEADVGMEMFEDGTYKRDPVSRMLESPVGAEVSESGTYEIKGQNINFYPNDSEDEGYYLTLKYKDGKLLSTLGDEVTAYKKQ